MSISNDNTVLILGATGRFGAAAVAAFAEAGWRVLAQSRSAQASLPQGVKAIAAALSDTDGIVRAAQGAQAVVYAVNPPYTDWATQAMPLAQQGMDIASRLSARFMLPGNVYNYGASMPALLDEATPQQPTTRKGKIRFDMEAELAARASTGLSSVVIRAGDFFGSGTGSWFDLAIVKSIHKGTLMYPGPLDRTHAWAYVPDLARAFVAVAAQHAPQRFSSVQFPGHALTGEALLIAIEREARALGFGRQAPFKRTTMPWPIIRAGGWLVPAWREIAEMAYLWTVPHALDGASLTALVGDLPVTPLEVALRQTLLRLKP
jgi:nucleoside-diphosphate-sugar epimerase